MYSYTLGGKRGKKVSLQESKNRVVVRTRNARSIEDAIVAPESREALKNFNIELKLPEADVTVFHTDKKQTTNALRDRARKSLKKEPELRFAGRVLEDKKSKAPVLYTENIFIKFHDSITSDACEKFLAKNNLVIIQKMDSAKNFYFVKTPENTGLKVFEIAETLLTKKEVELCHPEILRQLSYKLINPKQWHLKSTTINGQQVNANVKADRAHLLTQGENITIAVIDDGVDIDNPEFIIPGKVVSSRDVTLNRNDPRPVTIDSNHGTACAGVATASGINASGVAPLSKLMPIRLRSWLGSINEANAFKWAVDHGADVISCSWGPNDGVWWEPNDPKHTERVDLMDSTRLAIDDAVTRGRNGLGCVIFFAAGNGNENTSYDGYSSYEKVISVAACNDTNMRSVYSDFGDTVWCCFPSDDQGWPEKQHPDPITTGIYTTDRVGVEGTNPNGDYADDFGGTSSACPGAAGTAALILSANPNLTWLQVKEIIKDTCEKIDIANGQYDAKGHSKKYGYGKIDAEKAVLRAIALRPAEGGGIVKIISALVDPQGSDTGKEKIKLKNTSAASIDLHGWSIEVKGKKQVLSISLTPGQSKTITLHGPVKLANSGGSINLVDKQQHIVDAVSYKKSHVKPGVLIEF